MRLFVDTKKKLKYDKVQNLTSGSISREKNLNHKEVKKEHSKLFSMEKIYEFLMSHLTNWAAKRY